MQQSHWEWITDYVSFQITFYIVRGLFAWCVLVSKVNLSWFQQTSLLLIGNKL